LFPVVFETSVPAREGALLKSVKDELRRVPNRGLGYGLLRYLSEDAEISQTMRALPQAEVRFNYLGQLDNVLPVNSHFSLSTGATGAERNGKQRRAYLLDVTSAVSGGRLQLNIIYSENVHRHAVIENLSRSLMEALRALISHCQSLESSDLTPADFPLAKLSQQQLDRIMSKTSGGVPSHEN
jgi:non-ribosomal peptide synthase protein (TIGR01720 family)